MKNTDKSSKSDNITSLQQEPPEVELEKEIKLCWMNWLSPSNKKEVEGVLPKTEFEMYARHFYELGINAGREKPNGVNGVVHHALKSHWIVTDKNKLAAILKAFPEGAEVELFITAKKEKIK
jgi:hypothetical protein